MGAEIEGGFVSLGRVESWAWRRHGEETLRAREELNPLDRLEAEGQARAFQEVSKYIDAVRAARGSGRPSGASG